MTLDGATTFSGPFTGGPPPEALVVRRPSLRFFGPAEAARAVTVVAVVFGQVALALGRWSVRRRRTWQEAAAEGLVEAFCRLGPMFIKLGQLMGSSPSVFPAPLPDAALRCIREVGPLSAATVRQAIEDDLGRPAEEIFASFDDRPLSAASVAQVHACVLPDGRQAVVKVQRPGIRRTMTADLRVQYRMMLLARRFSRFARDANVVGAIEDLHTVTYNELNFAVEAKRQSRFRAGIGRFGDNTGVTAPEVYWECCGPKTICMERLFGVPFDDFVAVRDRLGEGKLQMRWGVKVWLEACLVDGVFHGDVHAGNIWALDDGRIAFLDFGIMGELTDGWKQAMRDFFETSTLDNDFSRVSRSYKAVGAFPEEVGPDDEVGSRLAAIFTPMFDAGLGVVPMAELLTAIIRTMGAHSGGAGTPKELQLIIKQLLYFERYSKELAPDWPMFRDLYLVRNIFPEAVAALASERNVELPR